MTSKEKLLPVLRPWRATGRMFVCEYCGGRFYRRASQIKRGITKSCGKPLCKSLSMRGANNPFWGKNHSPEVITRIETAKRARPVAPPKGYKHTPEARSKISIATKHDWIVNRDKRLAANPPHYKPNEERRYRYNFTKVQKLLWQDDKCAWCDSTDNLVLDHIISVMCGGLNTKENAQTLCMPCNRWKLKYIDRPLLLAGFRQPGG